MATVSSTATYISYDLRPAKQSERRILLDVLALAGECGLKIGEYRYVGMGANRFYDFFLFHRYLALSTMVSLEHDPAMFERALFNVPFKFITVKNETVQSFLASDESRKQSVYWLDYDRGVTTDAVGDIATLGPKMKLGDFCFVTVPGGVPGATKDMNSQDRLAWIQEAIGDVAGGVEARDVEKAAYPEAVRRILLTAFTNVFAANDSGVFAPLLGVRYTDSMPMVTVGGAFLGTAQANAYRRRIKKALPFLAGVDSALYNIEALALTERERALFDRAATARRKGSKDEKRILGFGFTAEDVAAYRQLLRYLPRYVETIV